MFKHMVISNIITSSNFSFNVSNIFQLKMQKKYSDRERNIVSKKVDDLKVRNFERYRVKINHDRFMSIFRKKFYCQIDKKDCLYMYM